MTDIRPEALSRLRETFAGDVITPADTDYERARHVWNGMIDRHPALVVRPTSVADVQAAVRFGRDNQLLIAIRGGGHSLAGFSTCDDGLVVDLSRMRGVKVDPAKRTARVNGGSLLSELDTAAQQFGLVCPVGVVGHTGVGGLTLGGGMGRLQRRFGLTIDNVVALEVVTADGRHVRANANENPDLFWAMRGAGANFGVVTAFEFRLHEMQPMITRGTRVYPASRIQQVWSAFRSFAESAPDHLHLALNIGWSHPELGYPDPIATGPIVTASFNHSGDPAHVARDVAPLAEAGPAALETDALERYLDVQTSADIAQSWGHRYYNKGGFVNDLPAEALERMVEHVADGGAMGGAWGVWAQGGAMARVDDDATAFTGRSALFDMSSDAQWDERAQDDERIAWARGAMAIAEPYAATGRYVNEVTDTGEDMASSIYGDAKMRRLRALKAEWDPDNVFRLNQNIKP
jgi:FAD/FMN-containing dehydrogenase